MARPTPWELYEANVVAVRTMLRRRGVCTAELEDLVQMVFVVALRRRDVVPKEPMRARAWLLDVANRQAANWRRLWRHTWEVRDEEVIATALAEPEDAEGRAAVVDEVDVMLDGIEPRDRELLVRRFLLGETFRDIGAVFGVSKSIAGLWLDGARGKFCAARQEGECAGIELST